MKTFFTSIPQFFVLLWVSVLRLFTFGKTSQEQATSDLESGLSVSTMAKTDPGSDESVFTVHVDVDDTQLQANEAVDISTPAKPGHSSTGSSLPRRKTSLRQATVIQKEDKLSDVILPAAIIPDLVASVPCTIQPVTINRTSSFKSTKAEQVARRTHSANLVKVNKIETAEKSIDLESESTRDLRELFNGPPPRSAPTPPSSSGLPALPTANLVRILVESCAVYASGAVHMRPALILTGSNSESTLSVQSPSFDMAQFSLDGNLNYLSPETAYNLGVSYSSEVDHSNSQEDNVSDDLAACFTDASEDDDASEDEALRLAWKAYTVSRQSVTITNHDLSGLTSQDNLTLQEDHSSQDSPISLDDNTQISWDINGHYDFRDLPYSQDSDDTLCSTNSKCDSDSENITAKYTPPSTPKVLGTHYHTVVDGFTPADHHKCDNVNENHWSKIGNTATPGHLADSVLRDLLRTSPSEDAVVDCLFAQLEQECHGDEEDLKWGYHRVSLALSAEQVLSSSSPSSDEVIESPRMRKSKMIAAAVAKDTKIDQAARASWEASLDSVIQAFREMQTEDEIFRGLFDVDSPSFYSQASMENISVEDTVVCNNDKSEPEPLALCEAPRDVAQVVDTSDEFVNMALVVKDVRQAMDAKVGESEDMPIDDSDDWRGEHRLARFSWTSTESSTTTEGDESVEVGNSSDSD